MMNCKGIVLVTGGSGLIGKALQDEIRLSNFSNNKELVFVFLSSKDGNLTNFEEAKVIFNFYKPDYVIHLAAKVGGLYANMNENRLFYEVNSKINENVLKLAFEFKVKKCISCLSTCIFPAKIDYPFDEQKIHLGPPHESNVGYSIAKRQVDLLNMLYNGLNPNELNPSFTSFIPTNIYGCNDNFKIGQAHVIPDLIRQAFETKADYLIVSGSGKPLRQFIYAPDLAKLILWCFQNYHSASPILLCPDESDEISISHLAELIVNFVNKYRKNKLAILYDPSKSDGQFKKTASNSKFRNLYPSFKFTSIEEGLEQVIDWYYTNKFKVK